MKFIYPVLLLTVLLILQSVAVSSLRVSLNYKKIASLCSSLCLIALPVNAQNLDNGEALFTSSCSGCHAGGSNILNGQKTLFTKALDKYGYNTQETMVTLISKGKGQMPAYASFISPKGI
jgi:cytochrome c6